MNDVPSDPIMLLNYLLFHTSHFESSNLEMFTCFVASLQIFSNFVGTYVEKINRVGCFSYLYKALANDVEFEFGY